MTEIIFTDIIRPLANYDALCFGNAFFQIFLKIKQFQNYIQDLDDTHALKITQIVLRNCIESNI